MKKYFQAIDKNILFTAIVSILFFSLGTSLSHYLGTEVNFLDLVIGFFWVISIQLAAKGYLLLITPEGEQAREDIFNNQDDIYRFRLLMLFIFFAGIILLSVLLIGRIQIISLWVLIFLSYVGLFLIPSIKRGINAFMPIIFSIFQASIIPAFAFNLFTLGFHKSLVLMAFPLTLLLVAIIITNQFSTYARDETLNRKTILRTIGWRRGILLNHAFLITSVIFLLLNVGKGLPSNLLLPIALSIPLIILDISWLQRIRAGYNPIWPLFNALTNSIVFILVYLLTYTFWIN